MVHVHPAKRIFSGVKLFNTNTQNNLHHQQRKKKFQIQTTRILENVRIKIFFNQQIDSSDVFRVDSKEIVKDNQQVDDLWSKIEIIVERDKFSVRLCFFFSRLIGLFIILDAIAPRSSGLLRTDWLAQSYWLFRDKHFQIKEKATEIDLITSTNILLLIYKRDNEKK